MSTLCVIPVRGGSKGIPRKNLRDVGGKPLVVWTIEQALEANDVRVVVSTEDEEIASVARAAGAEVIDRPAELAQDTTATEPVIVHAMDYLRDKEGYEPEFVMLLQATSPVRRPGTIDRAIAQARETGVDSLVGTVPQTPFLWWTARDGHGPTADFEVDHRPRQFRSRETGSLYVTKPWVYRERNNRIGGNIGLFVMDEVEGIDIDGPLDLALAGKTLIEMRQQEGLA